MKIISQVGVPIAMVGLNQLGLTRAAECAIDVGECPSHVWPSEAVALS